MKEILSIKSIHKSFRTKKVLEDFNMSLEGGKVYGLLGMNGAGKTTLIRIVLGILPPDKGEIVYKNRKIDFNSASYKKEIGYIPEDPFFFSWMSIQELLDLNASFYPSWRKEKAEAFLQRFSLERKSRIKHLSRGMKLKLGLIVALASEPALLILDDPTSGLDVPTRQDFLKDIIQEISEAGTTILFSTHLVHEIEGIIDHLSILHGGSLIVDEDYQSLKNSIKRVQMSLGGTLLPRLEMDGILKEKRKESRVELVIYHWNEEKQKKIEALSPVHLEIEGLSLEEIFISFVSGDGGRKGGSYD